MNSKRAAGAALAVILVAAVAVGGYALLNSSDGNSRETTQATNTPAPAVTADESTTPTPSPNPTPEETKEPEEPLTAQIDCDDIDRDFNADGAVQPTLPRDCDQDPVTEERQAKSGLGLACGGTHPVIVFKTRTDARRVSVCGKDASGVDFRVVAEDDDGHQKEMAGWYDWERDTYVGESDETIVEVAGYDGGVRIIADGSVKKEKSIDFLSLDMEYDDGD